MSIVIDGTSGITPLAFSSNLQFTSTGQRITGDLGSSPASNRVMFQSSVTNGNSWVSVLPNGTGVAGFDAYLGTDPANSTIFRMYMAADSASLRVNTTGTGSNLPMTFWTGGSERMCIDTSGNVGVGTASPGSKLQVNATSGNWLQLVDPTSATNGDKTVTFRAVNPGTSYLNLSTTAYQHIFNVGGSATEAMRLDSSGNLGLGVTPSAWASGGWKALQIPGGSVVGYGGSPYEQIHVTNNSYYDGTNWRYVASNYASNYYQTAGQHVWRTAPSGTAGDVIGFTQAMTLDASGRLGIGTSSPGFKLQVQAEIEWPVALQMANPTTTHRSTYLTQRALGSLASPTAVSAGTVIGGMEMGGYNSSTYTKGFDGGAAMIGYAEGTWTTTSTPSSLVFFTNQSGAAGYTERMRIDSSGNVGIGTATPNAKFGVAGTSGSAQARLGTASNGWLEINAYDANPVYCVIGGSSLTAGVFGTQANVPTIFFVNNTEKARIDTAGNFLVTTNTTYGYQAAPTSKAAAATLTGAELVVGLLNTTGTTYTITLPTGTNIDASVSSSLGVNGSFDWSVINTASGTITIAANGNTTLGPLTVPTASAAMFRFRKTAANTYTVYRIG